MRARNRLVPACFAALLAVLPARAQAPDAPPVYPDETLVEELVVVARYGGPAFWRVEDADTVVYVLGTPSLAPKRMQWDRSQFERRLKGANEVILPAAGNTVKLKGVPAAAVAYLRLRSSTPFEERLDPETRARFAAARESLGQPAKAYGTSHPLAAAILMINHYRDRHELTDQDPNKLVRELARQAGVRVRSKSYDLGPLLMRVANISQPSAQVCLDETLDQVRAGPGRTLAATRAWAEGDVPGALTNERILERCLAVAPGAAAHDARIKADQAQMIAEALQRPGHAIALVQLRPLLSQGGVLDRLRSQGFVVKTPGE